MGRIRHRATPTMGLLGATFVGVGAIVGGGILALAGTAFAAAGPAAIVAFAGNALIAGVTALVFGELAARFPQSGGTYTFAKRVMPVGTAFGVGWIVYFASIAAASLYALGFGAFVVGSVRYLLPGATQLVGDGAATLLVAATAVLGLAWRLVRSPGGGGAFVNVAKLAVFAVLIAGGAIVSAQRVGEPSFGEALAPFLPFGAVGVLSAMGYSFIAFQGFDLIAAVSGEVRDAARNVPRAMLASLGVAVGVYVPLVLVVLFVGVPPGAELATWAGERKDTVLADAAGQFLGPVGFWLVMAAGVLSMYSALQANLFAASRLAQAMARDSTLPRFLELDDPVRGTPARSIGVTAGVVLLIVIFVGDVSAAGAASSLIFLVTFALAHLVAILARRRATSSPGFRAPLYPYLPVAGLVSCTALAVFQGVVVPVAGAVTLGWLVLGGFLYAFELGQRARVYDAAAEAADPELLTLRGRNPLVLVPAANPATAEALVGLAVRFATPRVGRVMLLHVIRPGEEARAGALDAMGEVLHDSMDAALRAGVHTDALVTLAGEPLTEIERVARTHDCATLLLGMSRLDDERMAAAVERLFARVGCDVAVLRAPRGWQVTAARRILVPISVGSPPNHLRARLLTHLTNGDHPVRITYMMAVSPEVPAANREHARRLNEQTMVDEVGEAGEAELELVLDPDPRAAIVAAAAAADLVVLGLDRQGRRRTIGALPRAVLAGSDRAVLLIGRA